MKRPSWRLGSFGSQGRHLAERLVKESGDRELEGLGWTEEVLAEIDGFRPSGTVPLGTSNAAICREAHSRGRNARSSSQHAEIAIRSLVESMEELGT